EIRITRGNFLASRSSYCALSSASRRSGASLAYVSLSMAWPSSADSNMAQMYSAPARPMDYPRRLVTLVSLRKTAAASPGDLKRCLPTTRAEVEARGWDALDVLIVNGDAYVDRPAFGGALIGRFLERRGLRVGMIAQPSWRDTSDLLRMGAPRLFV